MKLYACIYYLDTSWNLVWETFASSFNLKRVACTNRDTQQTNTCFKSPIKHYRRFEIKVQSWHQKDVDDVVLLSILLLPSNIFHNFC